MKQLAYTLLNIKVKKDTGPATAPEEKKNP